MDTGSRTLSVASLNTAGLPGHLPPIAQRAVGICGYFEGSDVQVINLQEVWRRRDLRTFQRLLPSYPFVGWQPGTAGHPCGGLVTFSRLPLGKVCYTSFRSSRPVSGGVRFRLGMRIRSALHGVLTSEILTVRAILGNTHLVANFDGDWSAENRHHRIHRDQIGILHHALARAREAAGHSEAVVPADPPPVPDSALVPDPVLVPAAALAIVTGDFNVASDGPLYPAIIDGGVWRDPFAATDPPTFHAEYLPADAGAHRIDYLLVAGDEQRYRVLECGLLFGEPVVLPDGRSTHLSDHVGIRGRIALA